VSTFAILSLVIMVVIVGVVAVVARQLWQTLRHTIDVLRAAGERLRPLADELQAELAVTTVETEALRSGVERLRQPRARRHRSLADLRSRVTKRTSRWPRRR
jgi:predicted PurR-regulated permease PerM